jgi:putative acyl-CoA dehydrogenase
MSVAGLSPSHQTHDVENQPPALGDFNPFAIDRALQEGLAREGAGFAREDLLALGARIGGEPLHVWGFQANAYPPVLKAFDLYGNRVDEVEYHPAWHALTRLGVEAGVHANPWREPKPGAHVARAGLFYLLSQAEAGFLCPLSMTFSVVPALRAQPELAREWEPRFTSRSYDPRSLPAPQKSGAICGMAMTEKQGGSDVRANTTRARPLGKGGPGEEYELMGHKWFCSAPMSDAFLALAQTPKGLSCFLLPRWLPDGTRNRIQIQRLKDKMGNRSNASSEIEYNNAWARMVGEEGRGVATIIEMVAHTRLDCTMGGAAVMRIALTRALHHARHRSAFGRRLWEQPLMRNVLTDLALESEAATLTMLRLARAYDEGPQNPEQKAFARLATAVGKYWVTRRSITVAAEALECLGGLGYCEDSGMPRLLREAPVNAVWEGSGNVICLDVLRAIAREPGSLEAFFNEVEKAKGADARLDRAVIELKSALREPAGLEVGARRVVEKMALALQASLFLRHGDGASAQAFCRSRLGNEGGLVPGTLPADAPFEKVLERAWAE